MMIITCYFYPCYFTGTGSKWIGDAETLLVSNIGMAKKNGDIYDQSKIAMGYVALKLVNIVFIYRIEMSIIMFENQRKFLSLCYT